jgi:hypothetical protein
VCIQDQLWGCRDQKPLLKEELMCRVLGDLLEEGVVVKLAGDLHCDGKSPDDLLQLEKSGLQSKTFPHQNN